MRNTITFRRADVKAKSRPGYDATIALELDTEDGLFPNHFYLVSPKTGAEVKMVYNIEETNENAAQHEFWDGEMDVRLFSGTAANGRTICVEMIKLPECYR